MFNINSYKNNICPTCKSDYNTFSCKREEWRNSSCNCYRQNKLWLDYLLAGIPYEYFSKDFLDYEFKDISRNKKFYEEIKKFVELIDNVYETGSCLYLYNEIPSTGKTFFAVSILKEAYKKDYSIAYLSFSKIYNNILNNKFEIFEKINKIDFLVIDSIDQRVKKEFLTDIKLLNYFEEFLRNRCKPIIFTGLTNLLNQEYDVLHLVKKILKNKVYELHIDSDLQYETKNFWDNIKEVEERIIK